jgi:predicted dehydrogenase
MRDQARLRVGIAGFGRLAREYYLPALAHIGYAQVTAVADPLESSRQTAQRRFSLKAYVSVEEMLAAETLDALLVASPPSSHVQAWRAAREQRIAAFVEKPFALASQLESLPAISDEEAGLMVNFNRRFWPNYQRVTALVRQRTIGELRAIHYVLQTNILGWSTVTQHRLWGSEGGVLHDLGSQAIDVVSNLAQREPENIFAFFGGKRPESDRVRLEIDFPGDIHACCDLGYCEQNRESLAVLGSKASILLREPNMAPHVSRLETGGSLREQLSDYAVMGYRFLRPGRRMLRFSIHQALTKFLDSVRSGGGFDPGYSDAIRNVRLLARAAAFADNRSLFADGKVHV